MRTNTTTPQTDAIPSRGWFMRRGCRDEYKIYLNVAEIGAHDADKTLQKCVDGKKSQFLQEMMGPCRAPWITMMNSWDPQDYAPSDVQAMLLHRRCDEFVGA